MFATILFAMTAQAAPLDPFSILRDAYARRDADLAARAYVDNAEVEYRYDGVPKETFIGADAIRDSFESLFSSVSKTEALDLNFRITSKSTASAEGFYRLRFGRQNASYGRFSVRIAPDGRLASDLSTSASRDDFEDASGPVALAADVEDLDRDYYAAMAGRYRLPDGCTLVVTRSIVRLFVRNTCTQQWRGLARVSGREWTAGNRTVDATVVSRYLFSPFVGGVSPSVTVTDEHGNTVQASRADQYSTQNVSFTSADGTELAGTLYLPTGAPKQRAATVMVHGSGPQDRDGFASLIAVMSDALASEGRVVLAYDKRGSGLSAGNGDKANFEALASDARSAMKFLAHRVDVDPEKIGLAGSSQAGWVIAKTIEAGAAPADVLLLGAAGAAISVRRQNMYNTDIQMACRGISPDDRRVALAQQSAFFDFLADPNAATRLDMLSDSAAKRASLSDWLFPRSSAVDRSDGSWFNILAIDYDPLPTWKKYRGRSLFLFGEFDDATPTPLAVNKLSGSKVVTRIIPAAQHLGLVATSKCSAGLSDVSRFEPALFRHLTEFARK